MKKLVWALLLVGVAGVIVWGVLRKNEPPQVKFARVKRQTLVSTLPTNGKAEPVHWEAMRAETAGVVSRIAVEDGQTVAKGAVLAGSATPPCSRHRSGADQGRGGASQPGGVSGRQAGRDHRDR